MTTANAAANRIAKREPVWHAEVTLQERTIIEEFVEVSHPNDDDALIQFRVNRRNDRLVSFTDYREQDTGTAGTAGIWGTLPQQPPGKRRSLTPTAFRHELAALVGEERADEILTSLSE